MRSQMDVTSLRFPWSFSQFIYISQSLSERKSVPAASTACSQALEKEIVSHWFLDAGTEQGRKVLALIKGYEHPHLFEIRFILIIYILQSVFQVSAARCLEIQKAHTQFFPPALPQQNKYRQQQKPLTEHKILGKYRTFITFVLYRLQTHQCSSVTPKSCAAMLQLDSYSVPVQ